MQRIRYTVSISALLLMFSIAGADDMGDSTELISLAVGEESLLDLKAFEAGAVLSDAELNTHRAREDIKIDQVTIQDSDQNGDVEKNVAIGNTNGGNAINGDAFSNSSGFMSTVQNTGNNVLIQTSTIINVSVDTPTQ